MKAIYLALFVLTSAVLAHQEHEFNINDLNLSGKWRFLPKGFVAKDLLTLQLLSFLGPQYF